jgi:hypothetical protein
MRSSAYIVLGLILIYYLPTWGGRILTFLRDLDDYRASRRDRQARRKSRNSD